MSARRVMAARVRVRPGGARGLVALLVAGLMLAACASSGAEIATGPAEPPEVLYAKADELMEQGSFLEAAKMFEQVDREHPYAPEARRAIVMSAYSYYRGGAYDDAVSAGQRYTTLHPGTEEAALAQHVIAMSQYDRITDPQRDQSRTKQALKALETIVRRYPDSRYAEEAQGRINGARDVLAAAEMNVGRYYLKRHNHLAAINRFRVVVTDYQTTAHVEEALMRLTEAYMALGIQQEAQTAAAVLGHNFPDSEWYDQAYSLLGAQGLHPHVSEDSWITRTWRGVKPV